MRNPTTTLSPLVERSVAQRKPFLWLNDGWRPIDEVRIGSVLSLADVYDAERRLKQFAGLLATLFPELKTSGGIIESPLYSAQALQRAMMNERYQATGRWLIKGDHALPVAGSIKARGGIYEVLVHAEHLALRDGVMNSQDDRLVLLSPEARQLFARQEVVVGSTGNLGLSIGVMAAALGFRATVHMSTDAKQWKKSRLRARGVEVVEHDGDFGAAVSAGRQQAGENPNAYFVDDENSSRLFLGYSVAAVRLRQQLIAQGVEIGARNPLFVYIPCGVGGAPGGITFGLRHLLGDHVHCFFAEPAASPCMLIRLAAAYDSPLSVRDVGLDNRTEADGLAVAQASEFVACMMRSLVSGVFTVSESDFFEDLYVLEQSAGLRVEPSATASFRGPRWVLESEAGRHYLANHGLLDKIDNATHLLWSTGGAFVPDEEYRQFHERGRSAWMCR